MSVFHICMWCLLVISVVHSQEMKTILLFTACLLNSNLWTSCECHTVNKAFLLNCSMYSLSHEKTPLQDQILIYVAFCFAKRKWRLGTICKRRIVESPKLTSVYWRTRSTQPWDWNWLFWQTVKKEGNLCLMDHLLWAHRVLSEKQSKFLCGRKFVTTYGQFSQLRYLAPK